MIPVIGLLGLLILFMMFVAGGILYGSYLWQFGVFIMVLSALIYYVAVVHGKNLLPLPPVGEWRFDSINNVAVAPTRNVTDRFHQWVAAKIARVVPTESIDLSNEERARRMLNLMVRSAYALLTLMNQRAVTMYVLLKKPGDPRPMQLFLQSKLSSEILRHEKTRTGSPTIVNYLREALGRVSTSRFVEVGYYLIVYGYGRNREEAIRTCQQAFTLEKVRAANFGLVEELDATRMREVLQEIHGRTIIFNQSKEL